MEYQNKDTLKNEYVPRHKKVYNDKFRRMIFISILLSQALVLSYIERSIPVNFAVPGAKLGLANIITLTSLYFLTFKEALTLVILRTILTSFFGGSVSFFLYSIAGGLFSFIIMYLLIKFGKDKVSTIGVSVVGAVFHNIGQLSVAGLMIKNFNIIWYLPFLMFSGVVTGLVVGFTSKYLIGSLRKLKYFK